MAVSLVEWCIENNREDILQEWDTVKNGDCTPKNLKEGSNKKIWWKD